MCENEFKLKVSAKEGYLAYFEWLLQSFMTVLCVMLVNTQFAMFIFIIS